VTTASHAAAGALMGALLVNPVWAFGGGLVSHAIMDVVPHYDLPRWEVDAVLTVALSAGFIALSGGEAAVVWGVVGGVLPDLENLVMKLGWIRSDQRIFPTHDGPLPHGRALGAPHALVQVAIAVAAAWLITT